MILVNVAKPQDEIHRLSDAFRKISAPWAIELQGLCHDDENYFLTQRDYLWKIPRRFKIQAIKKEDSKNGIFKTPIPISLRLQGGDHMGDCDAHDGKIFIPLEGISPLRMMIFDAKTLDFISAPTLPTSQINAPWVTVDSHDGAIITGAFNINSDQGIFRLKLSEDLQTLEEEEKILLKNKDGESINLRRIQGVDITRSRNIIWFVSDGKKDGLYGFELDSMKLAIHHKVKYRPGFPFYEELEGVDTLEDGERLENYDGNLFVSMLNNNLIFQDSGYLKSFDQNKAFQ